MLNRILHGTPTDLPPLLIAHGLFGSARNWGVIARRLSDERQVIAVDMRNHGESFHSDTHTYPELAEDLAEVLDGLERPADVLGHSMGGKAAMVLALRHPGRIRRLIVADIAPVRYGHTQMELIDAMNGVRLSGMTRRSEADACLARTVTDPGIRAFLLQSLDVSAERWRLNLATLAREMDTIIGWPDTIQGTFPHPTLFLTGALSTYVTAAHRPVIRELFPKARFARLADAGHWLHAEKPRDFETTVRTFLSA